MSHKLSKKNTENCYIVPAYKNMSPYALPNEFSIIQAQDLSKIGAIQDLVHGVKKLVNEKKINSDSEVKSDGKLWKFFVLGLLVFILFIITMILVRKKSEIVTETIIDPVINNVIIRDVSYNIDEEYDKITLDSITNFGEDDIIQLGKIKSIKNLCFKNCILDNLDFLFMLKNIKGVEFDGNTNINNYEIGKVCENIESFKYDYTKGSESWDGLEFLNSMPNLISVCVPLCEDLTPLSNLHILEEIELRSQKNSIIDNFQWCNGLEKVKLLKIGIAFSTTMYVGDNYLSGIENLKNIEELYLAGTIGKDKSQCARQKDIDYISQLVTLKKLTINYGGVGSTGNVISLINFQKLNNLEYIKLKIRNNIDINGLNSLSNLKYLEFSSKYSSIFQNDLKCLSSCKELNEIHFYLEANQQEVIKTGENSWSTYAYRNFSLKGIEELYNLRVLEIRSLNAGGIRIFDEDLAKNNNRLEYITGSSIESLD